MADLFYFVFNEYKNLNCLSKSDTIDIQGKKGELICHKLL